MSPGSQRTPEVEAFWRRALAATPELKGVTEFAIWSFGDNQELCDHVLAETLAGRNRATASLLWDYEDRLPQVGDVAIVTDWSGVPCAVLVTRRVHVAPFDQVDEAFARAEGYVIDPVTEWREVHWAYFSRRCAALGRGPSHDMPVVCELFSVAFPVYDPGH